MGLSEYRRKRDFQRTLEPKGSAPARRARAAPPFVVQKHDASRLHYDLRLEHGGVLKSWAVPKGPSLDPRDKVLAVQVEDHPLEYGAFEGTIPAGEYGGGTVMLWDRGTWEPRGDPAAGLRDGRLKFELRGERLKGGWMLVRMHGRAGGDGKNWLLVKEKDEFARSGAPGDIRTTALTSVKTARTMDQIAAGARPGSRPAPAPKAGSKRRPPVSTSLNGSPRSPASRRVKAGVAAAKLTSAAEAPMPASISPQLAILRERPPSGDQWLHEVKFDGYRILAFIRDGKARLVSRAGKDWTARFPGIAAAAAALPVQTAIVDGEVTALNAQGQPDFQALQNSMKSRRGASLAYFVFDLPYCDGFDLTSAPLVERKKLLASLAGGGRGPIRFSDHIPGRGADVVSNACRMGLEGIISKRADGRYSQRRTDSWVKVKCIRRQEFVIGGFTAPAGSRSHFGALLVGVHDADGHLVYAGKVGTGFDERLLKSIRSRLRALETPKSPFNPPPRGPGVRGATWVRPALVAEVAFTEWTSDGSLRHPAFVALREDKPASEVVREEPAAPLSPPPPTPSHHAKKAPTKTSKTTGADAEVAGIRLSSPGRVIYPEEGITKLDLARYYERIADHILPHIAGRPITLVRCPRGRQAACFYQKHVTADLPDAIRGVDVGGGERYAVIHDLAGLVALVQMSVLEIHPWGSKATSLDRPDRVIFDLDPGPGISWPDVVGAAAAVRQRLADAGQESFVKTTGGKGLHVVAPLDGSVDWESVKAFSHGIASSMAQDEPDRYTATLSKAKRQGRIFVDYLRNSRGATAVGAYSSRARPGATVSTPLRWSELSARVDPADFSITTVPGRLSRIKSDPWGGFFTIRQALPRTTASRPRRGARTRPGRRPAR